MDEGEFGHPLRFEHSAALQQLVKTNCDTVATMHEAVWAIERNGCAWSKPVSLEKVDGTGEAQARLD